MSKKPAQEPKKVRLVYVLHKGEGPGTKELVLHGGGRPYGLKIEAYDRAVGGEPTKSQIFEVPDPELAVKFVNSCSQLHFLHDDDLKLCFPNSSREMRSPLISLPEPQPEADQPEATADEQKPEPKTRKSKNEEK